jgi:hypothetical protein
MQVHQSALSRHGFCFETITGVSVKGNVITFRCYQFTYVLGKDGVVRVRRNERIGNNLPGFYKRWAIDFPEKSRGFEDYSKSGIDQSKSNEVRKE